MALAVKIPYMVKNAVKIPYMVKNIHIMDYYEANIYHVVRYLLTLGLSPSSQFVLIPQNVLRGPLRSL